MSRAPLTYDDIKALAAELDRPARTLIALSDVNDPFYIGPARQRDAEWFAAIWAQLTPDKGIHIRRLHYRLVSTTTFTLPNGQKYENTEECDKKLGDASLGARYLDLVPADWFDDRRNPDPIINLTNVAAGPDYGIICSDPDAEVQSADMPSLPQLALNAPIIEQHYHVEIWCEKTTMNDVLAPLARRYGTNLITGMGELSLTACVNVVERAQASSRPVRVMYVSDFDPKGYDMPVSVARKIEHRLALKGLELDIQVRPIALTEEQCREYELPRVPNNEHGSARFEARFGEGRTELDALEALHPGELHRIVEAEILRYFDADLDARVEATASDIQEEFDGLNEEVHAEHEAEIAELQASWRRITEENNRRIEQWREKAKPLWDAVALSLGERSPDLDDVEWPEPEDGDEDDDPLFDSGRDYIVQMARYKRHQGKRTARKKKMAKWHDMVCQTCKETFKSTRVTTKVCSPACQRAVYRAVDPYGNAERLRIWREANPEKHIEYNRRRRETRKSQSKKPPADAAEAAE
jgi:hypothetical protein